MFGDFIDSGAGGDGPPQGDYQAARRGGWRGGGGGGGGGGRSWESGERRGRRPDPSAARRSDFPELRRSTERDVQTRERRVVDEWPPRDDGDRREGGGREGGGREGGGKEGGGREGGAREGGGRGGGYGRRLPPQPPRQWVNSASYERGQGDAGADRAPSSPQPPPPALDWAEASQRSDSPPPAAGAAPPAEPTKSYARERRKKVGRTRVQDTGDDDNDRGQVERGEERRAEERGEERRGEEQRAEERGEERRGEERRGEERRGGARTGRTPPGRKAETERPRYGPDRHRAPAGGRTQRRPLGQWEAGSSFSLASRGPSR